MAARYDKYDPISGGFRAQLAAAWTSSDVGKVWAVGLNTSGKVVKGAGNSGVLGVLIIHEAKAINDTVDVMTAGELADFAFLNDGVTATIAGTAYYGDVTTGAITATATANKKLGTMIEKDGRDRFLVRVAPAAVGA